MPNIIIKEYDKTKAGIAAYENFSIVVPGFLGTPETGYSYDDVADENGIYECSSQNDFVKYVGKKVQSSATKTAKNAEPKSLGTVIVEEEERPIYHKPLTAEEFYVTYANLVYKAKDITTKDGYLVWVDKYDGNKKYKLEKVTKWVETDHYFVIEPGNEGHDKITLSQNGNQIAYELLGMGYTVLFKKLNTVDDLDDLTFWIPLKDKSTYDFRYVCTGGCYESPTAYNNIINLATHINTNNNSGRGDCVALLDIDETSLSEKTQAAFVQNLNTLINTCGDATKYSAIFAPKVIYAGKTADVLVYENLTFPASFHYLACAALARENAYAEWFAVAGYTRGISTKTVAGTTIKLGEVAVAAAQPRKSGGVAKAVNLVITERNGFFMWGNRTAHALDATDLRASHFLNIRQLCCTLKKDIYVACRRFTFDPNSDILWVNFCEAIKPTLEAMKANQGIQDYKIIKVINTQKAILTAKIRIVPIEAVEDFDISIFLENSITGVNVKADEE